MEMRKVRSIPRGYVAVDGEELCRVMRTIHLPEVADAFLSLYGKFGNPAKGGIFTYMLSYRGVILKVSAESREKIEYHLWISGGYKQAAERKRIKVMNVIARKVHSKGRVFIVNRELPEYLYSSTKKDNERLYEKLSVEYNDYMIESLMRESLTDAERQAVYEGILQFVPEVENVLREIFNFLNYGV